MRHPPLIAPDLRRLFRAIAHTTLASSWLAACADEAPIKDADAPHEQTEDAAISTRADDSADRGGSDAGPNMGPAPTTTTPTITAIPDDAGPGSKDAGPGSKDASVPADGGSVTVVSSEFERVPCPEFTALPSGELKTPTSISAVGIYAQARGYSQIAWPDGGQPPPTVTEIARSGAACAGMTDKPACEQELKLLANQLCATLPCQIAIAAEPNTLRRIDERAELLRQFGDIDTAAEAVLLAAFDGHRVCPGLRGDSLDIGAELRSTPSGYELRITREECGAPLTRTLLSVDAAGKLVVLSKEELRPARCAIGRRPPGLCPEQHAQASNETGKFLAELARLEHASIYAFYQLIHELRAHGAPEALRVMALDAMLDEVRHARDMETLAREFGAEIAWAQVKQTALRSLLEIAVDNAREGCVRETFGALLATYQAASAEDAHVRNVMARIAEDETRHAILSWKLMAWLSPLLSEREQRKVDEAKAEAQAELAFELETALPESVRRTLGLPGPEVAELLLRQMSLALPN